MRKWTPEIDRQADELYRTWTEAHIRRDQDIITQQIVMAYAERDLRDMDDVMLDLQAHHDALSRELLRRCEG